MQLTFGDMTLELNIFHLNDNPKLLETENHITDEVVSIDQCAEKKKCPGNARSDQPWR